MRVLGADGFIWRYNMRQNSWRLREPERTSDVRRTIIKQCTCTCLLTHMCKSGRRVAPSHTRVRARSHRCDPRRQTGTSQRGRCPRTPLPSLAIARPSHHHRRRRRQASQRGPPQPTPPLFAPARVAAAPRRPFGAFSVLASPSPLRSASPRGTLAAARAPLTAHAAAADTRGHPVWRTRTA